MRKVISIILILIFLSCKNNSVLGKNYFHLSSFEANDMGYPYGSIIYNSSKINLIQNVKILSDVEDVNYNNDYIIAIQQPNRSFMLKLIKDDLEFWNSYYFENKKDSLVGLVYKKMHLSEIHYLVGNKKDEKINIVIDSIFNNEPFYKKMFRNKYNYYIIEKTNDSVFGPLTLREFETIKKEKKIDIDFEKN